MRWLFTVRGEASPSAAGASGDFTLYSPDVNNAFTWIRLERGLKAKVWARRLEGTTSFRLLVQFSPDTTASPPPASTVDSAYLASPSSLELEKRRPVVIQYSTGLEGLKFAYSDTGGAGNIAFVAEVEVTDEDE
jgi:hypothetical protein